MAKKKTTEQFIKDSNKVHNNKYDYSLVAYKTNNVEVEILCPIHGKFNQLPSNHTSGKGCMQCGIITTANSKSRDTEYFVNKSKEIHNNKYDYSLVGYKANNINVTIICDVHGEFEQKPRDHYKGKGCKKCTYSSYEGLYSVKSANKNKVEWKNTICTFYLIELLDDNCLKVGLTTTTVKERFLNKIDNYKVIEEIKLSLYDAIYLENSILDKYKDFKISLSDKFSGHTECLNINVKNKIIQELNDKKIRLDKRRST